MAVAVETAAGTLAFALPKKREQLQKSFEDLDVHLAAIASCILRWRDVEDYLADAEKTVQSRFSELAEKEKAFEAKIKEREEALDKREQGILEREEASVARVQKQKDLAIAAIHVEKRKLKEETEGSSSEKVDSAEKYVEAAFENAADDNRVAIDKEASSSMPEKDVPSKSADDSVSTNASSVTNGKEPTTVKAVEGKDATAAKAIEVKIRGQLKLLCENMDGEGLRKYMVDRRKDVNIIRTELPLALASAIDPPRLVLSSLEGYSFPEQGGNQGEKKESGVSANRRACILLLECLAEVLEGHGENSFFCPVVKSSVKTLADQWKSRMNLQNDTLSSNSLDAQAFLQLLATFSIAHEYDEEELRRLVVAVARRRQAPVLCRALGLTAKMPEIVDQLANDGKQMEAIFLAHAFGIMDRLEPGPLLKTFLKEARKEAQMILKTGSNSAAAQNESTTKELIALKNVLKCIEEFHLEAEFPAASLQKRVAQLEKSKSDRKRVAVAVKAQSKRPRATNGASVSHGGSVVAMPAERICYQPHKRSQYGTVGVATYGLAMPSSFERRAQGAYGPTYAGRTHNSVAIGSYLYPADGLGSSIYGGAAYGNPSSTYTGYQFGSGLAPPPPPYQASFLC